MAVKKLAFNSFSAVMAVAIVLINWMSVCMVKALGCVGGKSALARNMTNRWARVADAGKREIL
jgi:hypothetical protein